MHIINKLIRSNSLNNHEFFVHYYFDGERCNCCCTFPIPDIFSGFLRSDTLIGTAQVKIQPLETAVEIHDSFDVSIL